MLLLSFVLSFFSLFLIISCDQECEFEKKVMSTFFNDIILCNSELNTSQYRFLDSNNSYSSFWENKTYNLQNGFSLFFKLKLFDSKCLRIPNGNLKEKCFDNNCLLISELEDGNECGGGIFGLFIRNYNTSCNENYFFEGIKIDLDILTGDIYLTEKIINEKIEKKSKIGNLPIKLKKDEIIETDFKINCILINENNYKIIIEIQDRRIGEIMINSYFFLNNPSYIVFFNQKKVIYQAISLSSIQLTAKLPNKSKSMILVDKNIVPLSGSLITLNIFLKDLCNEIYLYDSSIESSCLLLNYDQFSINITCKNVGNHFVYLKDIDFYFYFFVEPIFPIKMYSNQGFIPKKINSGEKSSIILNIIDFYGEECKFYDKNVISKLLLSIETPERLIFTLDSVNSSFYNLEFDNNSFKIIIEGDKQGIYKLNSPFFLINNKSNLIFNVNPDLESARINGLKFYQKSTDLFIYTTIYDKNDNEIPINISIIDENYKRNKMKILEDGGFFIKKPKNNLVNIEITNDEKVITCDKCSFELKDDALIPEYILLMIFDNYKQKRIIANEEINIYNDNLPYFVLKENFEDRIFEISLNATIQVSSEIVTLKIFQNKIFLNLLSTEFTNFTGILNINSKKYDFSITFKLNFISLNTDISPIFKFDYFPKSLYYNIDDLSYYLINSTQCLNITLYNDQNNTIFPSSSLNISFKLTKENNNEDLLNSSYIIIRKKTYLILVLLYNYVGYFNLEIQINENIIKVPFEITSGKPYLKFSSISNDEQLFKNTISYEKGSEITFNIFLKDFLKNPTYCSNTQVFINEKIASKVIFELNNDFETRIRFFALGQFENNKLKIEIDNNFLEIDEKNEFNLRLKSSFENTNSLIVGVKKTLKNTEESYYILSRNKNGYKCNLEKDNYSIRVFNHNGDFFNKIDSPDLNDFNIKFTELGQFRIVLFDDKLSKEVLTLENIDVFGIIETGYKIQDKNIKSIQKAGEWQRIFIDNNDQKRLNFAYYANNFSLNNNQTIHSDFMYFFTKNKNNGGFIFDFIIKKIGVYEITIKNGNQSLLSMNVSIISADFSFANSFKYFYYNTFYIQPKDQFENTIIPMPLIPLFIHSNFKNLPEVINDNTLSYKLFSSVQVSYLYFIQNKVFQIENSKQCKFKCDLSKNCVSSFHECNISILNSSCPNDQPIYCLRSGLYNCEFSSSNCDCPYPLVRCNSNNKCLSQEFYKKFCLDNNQLALNSISKCFHKKCWDLSCSENCPNFKVCPPGFFLCPDESCIYCNLGDCNKDNHLFSRCSGIDVKCNYFLCSDGKTCVKSIENCPSNILCSDENQVICPDNQCSVSVLECSISTSISFISEQMISCGLSMSLCIDGICRKSCSKIENKALFSLFYVNCPYNYIRCIDDSCRLSIYDCPSIHLEQEYLNIYNSVICPIESPYKSTYGSCITYKDSLNQPINLCSSNNWLCLDGTCVEEIEDCIRLIKCPENHYYCLSLKRCISTISLCTPNLNNLVLFSCGQKSVISPILCPKIIDLPPISNANICSSEDSFVCEDKTCVSNPFDCPTILTCPEDQPFYCYHEGLCKYNAQDCISINTCSEGYEECLDGSCSKQCGTQIACNSKAPFKCLDGTCRESILDCNNNLECPESKPFYCQYLSLCVSDRNLCPSNFPICMSPQKIRCTDGLCSNSLDQCITYSMGCPFGTESCFDGSCKIDVKNCPNYDSCPNKLPYRCKDGLCVISELFCNPLETCINSEYIHCLDGSCVHKDSQCPIPKCPNSSPIQCKGGMCVVSRLFCPESNLFSYYEDCLNTEFPCSNGQCVDDINQCTLLRPCLPNEIRCFSGVCVEDEKMCGNRTNTCPPLRPNFCYESGECHADIKFCNSNVTFEKRISIENEDNFECDVFTPKKCADGTCVKEYSECQPILKCSLKKSFKCYEGSCEISETQCKKNSEQINDEFLRNIECEDGLLTDSTLKCVDNTKRKCIDGKYYEKIEDCRTQITYLRGDNICEKELCWDGSCEDCGLLDDCWNNINRYFCNGRCVFSKNDCEQIEKKCPENTILCMDNICRNKKDCPPFNGCPANTPYHCYNGECSENEQTCSNNTILLTRNILTRNFKVRISNFLDKSFVISYFKNRPIIVLKFEPLTFLNEPKTNYETVIVKSITASNLYEIKNDLIRISPAFNITFPIDLLNKNITLLFHKKYYMNLSDNCLGIINNINFRWECLGLFINQEDNWITFDIKINGILAIIKNVPYDFIILEKDNRDWSYIYLYLIYFILVISFGLLWLLVLLCMLMRVLIFRSSKSSIKELDRRNLLNEEKVGISTKELFSHLELTQNPLSGVKELRESLNLWEMEKCDVSFVNMEMGRLT